MSSTVTALNAVPKHIKGRTIIASLPKKLAKRAVLSQNQHLRRNKKEEALELRVKRSQYFREAAENSKILKQQVHAERARRREDWVKGPLAPKRDAGAQAETYGAISFEQTRTPEKHVWKDYGIVVGDRVCVVEGRAKGAIGTVRVVRVEAEECTITGVDVANVSVPEYMLLGEADKTPVRPIERAIPLSCVRLVAPLVDPDTGKLRDHIINELTLQKVTQRERRGIDPPTRYITALDPPQYIPYPPKADESSQDEHEIDTLRIEVDEKTWVPTMRMPPMPPKVLDELRNKFSKFRIRHEDHYIKEVEKVDRKALRKQRMSNKMITPLKEKRRIERRERKELGRPELSEEALAKIGEVMARTRNRTVVDADSVPASTA